MTRNQLNGSRNSRTTFKTRSPLRLHTSILQKMFPKPMYTIYTSHITMTASSRRLNSTGTRNTLHHTPPPHRPTTATYMHPSPYRRIRPYCHISRMDFRSALPHCVKKTLTYTQPMTPQVFPRRLPQRRNRVPSHRQKT